DANRADARRLKSQRGPDLARERGNGCLAAGAGDGGDRLRLTRIEFRGGQCERATRVVDLNICDGGRQALGPLLGDDRRRTRGGGLLSKMCSVGLGARDRDKEVAW